MMACPLTTNVVFSLNRSPQMWYLSDRVTTRNFSKTKVEYYQSDTVPIGVPNRTNLPFLACFASTRISTERKPKCPVIRGYYAENTVDINGLFWTSKQGIGLRKGYEWLVTKGLGGHPSNLYRSILASDFFNINLSIKSRPVGRGLPLVLQHQWGNGVWT